MEVTTTVLSSKIVRVGWSEHWRFDLRHKFICQQCTFENSRKAMNCEICGGPRDPEFSPEGGEIEYQVKYFRVGKSMEVSKYSASTTSREIVIENLEPNTMYEGKLRFRLASGGSTSPSRNGGMAATISSKFRKSVGRLSSSSSAASNEWTEIPIGKFYFETLATDVSNRNEAKDRVEKFLKDQLRPYDEDPYVPDTYADKVSRVGTAALSASGMVGFGGKWGVLARNIYRVHRTGLAAFVFREDLQGMVIMLTSYVGSVAKEFQLSSYDISLGSYYLIWETKRENLLYPDMDDREHKLSSNEQGILQERADLKFLDEMKLFFALCEIAYRPTAAQMQWVLGQYNFELISCKTKAEKFRPAYALLGNKEKKTAVLAIRGTKEAADLTTDFFCDFEESSFSFHKDQTFMVHAGMLQAAKYLFCDETGLGLGKSIIKLHRAGYKIVLTGHSLGAGVASLLSLLLVDMDNQISLDVYGFGSPCCMCEELADALKGRFDVKKRKSKSKIVELDGRVNIINFIYRDDLISRLSLFSARLFASDIKRLKPVWKPMFDKDKASFTSRAKTLWAPNQRSQPVASKRKPNGEDEATALEDEIEVIKREILDDENNYMEVEGSEIDVSKLPKEPVRLVVPGVILHAYTYRGTSQVSLVDHRFGGLRRIIPSKSLLEDHKMVNIHKAIRDIYAARRIPNLNPPQWQSIEDHHTNGLYVKCCVCRYFVGWHHTGDSETVEIRATHHCFECGQIVCSRCSKQRCSLPHLGILSQVRVCDTCYSQIL